MDRRVQVTPPIENDNGVDMGCPIFLDELSESCQDINEQATVL